MVLPCPATARDGGGCCMCGVCSLLVELSGGACCGGSSGGCSGTASGRGI